MNSEIILSTSAASTRPSLDLFSAPFHLLRDQVYISTRRSTVSLLYICGQTKAQPKCLSANFQSTPIPSIVSRTRILEAICAFMLEGTLNLGAEKRHPGSLRLLVVCFDLVLKMLPAYHNKCSKELIRSQISSQKRRSAPVDVCLALMLLTIYRWRWGRPNPRVHRLGAQVLSCPKWPGRMLY